MTEFMETSAAQTRPELIEVAETVARDKGIDREEVLEAMETVVLPMGMLAFRRGLQAWAAAVNPEILDLDDE